jgi:hypothetical protein
VVVLAVDVALLGGLAAIDKAKGWDIIDLPWWAWLLLAAPALLLIVLLLAVPLAELSHGPVRNAGVALLGLGGTLCRRGCAATARSLQRRYVKRRRYRTRRSKGAVPAPGTPGSGRIAAVDRRAFRRCTGRDEWHAPRPQQATAEHGTRRERAPSGEQQERS